MNNAGIIAGTGPWSGQIGLASPDRGEPSVDSRGPVPLHPAQARAGRARLCRELVDTLAAIGGEASVVTLADELGRPEDGLNYHLRALAAAGLICEVLADASSDRRYRLAYDLHPEGNAAELRNFSHALLQIAERDFQDALGKVDAVVSGPGRELWALRKKGWPSDSDLTEVNALLEHLSELTSQSKAER